MYIFAKFSVVFNLFAAFRNLLLVSASSHTTLTILGLEPATTLPTLPKYFILLSSNPTTLIISLTSLVFISSCVSSIPKITRLFFFFFPLHHFTHLYLYTPGWSIQSTY